MPGATGRTPGATAEQRATSQSRLLWQVLVRQHCRWAGDQPSLDRLDHRVTDVPPGGTGRQRHPHSDGVGPDRPMPPPNSLAAWRHLQDSPFIVQLQLSRSDTGPRASYIGLGLEYTTYNIPLKVFYVTEPLGQPTVWAANSPLTQIMQNEYNPFSWKTALHAKHVITAPTPNPSPTMHTFVERLTYMHSDSH